MCSPQSRFWLFGAAVLVFVPAQWIAAGPPGGYYDSVDDSSAAALRGTLHEVIDDHTRLPYNSSGGTDSWVILEQAEEDPNDSGHILDIYRNASYPKAGGGNDFYNREHIWPAGYGFPDDNGFNYPYSDCHQLHLCDNAYNGARGIKPFRTCSPACTEDPTEANNGQGGVGGPYPGDSNWRSGSGATGTWETWLGRRGDVARTMFYMDVRYEGGTHGITGADEPDLILTDEESLIAASMTGDNEPLAYMGMVSVLLQWHEQDPVDAFEQHRNDVVFGFQGNRNPFVDHPEWVSILYADIGCDLPEECDDGAFCNGVEGCVEGVCVSGDDPCAGQGCDEDLDECVPLPAATPWINELHYDNSGTDTGEFVEIAGPAGFDLSGWKVLGYNGATGAVYKTVPLSGIVPDQGGCIGTLDFNFADMQNGDADGLALVYGLDTVVEFISYEGSFTALSGPAQGMQSLNIGVSEASNTPIGHSLQLSGSGAEAGEFSWQWPGPQTRGAPNNGQSFNGCMMACPTDLDGSGGTDSADLAILLGAWGPNPGHPADVDGDGTVAAADLALLLGAWGDC